MLLMKRYAISLLITGLLILSACAGPTTTTEPTEIPTTPQDSTSQTQLPTLAETPPPTPIVNHTTHGRIRWDETWRGGIHIIGDIIVEEGFTLTIEPGTKVLVAANSDAENLNTDPFNMKQGIRQEQPGEDPFYRGVHFGEPYRDEGNHISILILGTLYAKGMPDQIITITSDSPNPGVYDWNHFNFKHGVLSYCIMEYYRCLGPGDGTEVSHNILRHIGECAVCWGSGSALVEHNTIYDTGHEMIGTLNNSHVIRYNNLGPSNRNGIVVQGIKASPQIIDNTITGCMAGIAVFSGSPYISGNTIQDCKRGITLRAETEDIVIDEDTVFKDNTFSNNEKDIAYIRLQP